MRNALLVRAADGLIAVGPSWGTLSEVALAMRTGVPVVTLAGWQPARSLGADLDGPPAAETATDAVALLLDLLTMLTGRNTRWSSSDAGKATPVAPVVVEVRGALAASLETR